MMDSELKCQNELLNQLKQLQSEKESLEKHVFILNECLSIEELKNKISHLEKKQEMIVSLENLIGRLHEQIEPLNYLKMTLKTKLLSENQTNQSKSKSFIESKVTNSKFDYDSMKMFKTLPVSETLQSQSSQNIYPVLTKNDLISIQKLNDDLINLVQTPSSSNSSSNSISVINDESLDEAIQLLEQYDVVTDQEILNFSENHSKVHGNIQEPIASTSAIDSTNTISNEGTTMINKCLDAKNTNDQTKITEFLITKEKKNMDESVHNSATVGSKNTHSLESQNHKVFETEQSQTCSGSHDLYADINKLMSKLPEVFEEKTKTIKGCLEFISSLEKDVTNMSLKNSSKYDETLLKEDDSNSSKSQIIINEPSEQTMSSNESLDATNSNKNINSFNDMNLKIDILRGIYSLGFLKPTALQLRVIVQCVNGRDVIVFAGPGNGRTLMFTIPIFQRLRTNLNECQAIILVPTRDLAVHIQKTMTSVGDFLGVNICVGGDNVPKKLSVVPHVVVGTPAGVFNMIACKSLNTRCVQSVVINKADKMLTSNNPKLIEDIMAKLEKNKQVTVLTSDKMEHVLDQYMETLRDPMVIIQENCNEKNNLKNLPKQFYLNTQEDWKLNALCEIHETLNTQKAIIFCNTLDRAQKLCESLKRLEYPVALFHLEINALEREVMLKMFASNDLRMLVTTDPIKSNQFQQAAWIINYDLPINPVCYLDRITKCAENIRVLNLINENDDHTKLAIETHNSSYMIQMPLNMVDVYQY